MRPVCSGVLSTFSIRVLYVLFIAILNSLFYNSKLGAISDSGSDAWFVPSESIFCLFVYLFVAYSKEFCNILLKARCVVLGKEETEVNGHSMGVFMLIWLGSGCV